MINGLLLKDREYFEAHFQSAVSFIQEARLRHELYRLSMDTRNPSPWVIERIRQLKHAPACKEPWFVRQLEEELNNRRDDER